MATGTVNVTNRRHLLIGAMYVIWGAIATALGLPALVYLMLPPKIRGRQEWTEIGDVNNLAVDAPVEMAFRQNRVDGWKINSEKSTAWVLKRPDGSVIAFVPQCTHLGCAYHWEESRHEFLCPCHNSLFDVDGRVISGPAPRPLDRYDIRVQGSRLFVGRLHQSSEQA